MKTTGIVLLAIAALFFLIAFFGDGELIGYILPILFFALVGSVLFYKGEEKERKEKSWQQMMQSRNSYAPGYQQPPVFNIEKQPQPVYSPVYNEPLYTPEQQKAMERKRKIQSCIRLLIIFSMPFGAVGGCVIGWKIAGDSMNEEHNRLSKRSQVLDSALVVEMEKSNALLDALHWQLTNNQNLWNSSFDSSPEYIAIDSMVEWEDFYDTDWKAKKNVEKEIEYIAPYL